MNEQNEIGQSLNRELSSFFESLITTNRQLRIEHRNLLARIAREKLGNESLAKHIEGYS